MSKEFEVRWDGTLPAGPQEVWEAITLHTAGWLWKIDYEPRAGGTERGLSSGGGTVTAWDPPRHLATRAPDGDGINQLDYRLEPRGGGTHLRYVHQGLLAGDYERELDACRRHTAFYYHSLGEYVRHFPGKGAVQFTADAPDESAQGGFATLRRALGIADDAMVGDRVRLAPSGISPIEGVVDYQTPSFLGVRTTDALYRFFGRDAWGWPVGVAHHLFAADVDPAASQQAWSQWLNDVFTTERVA